MPIAKEKITLDYSQTDLPEFGYELLSLLPYAYSLYEKGLLENTVSGIDTAPFYFFSPKHEEKELYRGWKSMPAHWQIDTPNIRIHRNQLDWEHWSPPPLKEYWKDKAITFDKPTVVIGNRYNDEWGSPPINFFSLSYLKELFGLLSSDYQIVYVNFTPALKQYEDDAPAHNLGDYEMIKAEFPQVKHIADLMEETGYSLNELQCRIYAGCENFITMNGGLGILASYFGGTNIIYTARCREIEPTVNSFHSWYWRISNSNIIVVNSYQDLTKVIYEKFVNKLPLINIMVRTSHRKESFLKLIKEIRNADYKHIRILVSADTSEALRFSMLAPCNVIHCHPVKVNEFKMSKEYGAPFGPNLYFNTLSDFVTEGITMFIDDDDCFQDKYSLRHIAEAFRELSVQWAIWRVRRSDRLIPKDENFAAGSPPVAGDISGIGFAFRHDHWVDWTEWRRGDYRVSKSLYESLGEPKRIDKVLTCIG